MRTMLNFLSTGAGRTLQKGTLSCSFHLGSGGRHGCQIILSHTGPSPWGQSLCNLVPLAGDKLSAALQTCQPASHSAHTLSRPRFARELPPQALTHTAVSCHPVCTLERCLLLPSNSQPRSKLDKQEIFFAIQWTKTLLPLQESPKSSMFILSWVLYLSPKVLYNSLSSSTDTFIIFNSSLYWIFSV